MIESLGHYKILARIGAGGLGDLYRGRDAPRGRTVTIEVLPDSISADPDRRPGFMREAESSKALSHPNIAALHEVADDRGPSVPRLRRRAGADAAGGDWWAADERPRARSTSASRSPMPWPRRTRGRSSIGI